MTDFLGSLSIGMQIAQNRHKNFLEIHNVFLELKNQIENYSSQKVLIELISDQGDYFINLNEFPDILYQDKSLFASLAEDPHHIYSELTNLTFSGDGYPCSIKIDGNVYDSFDKTSLEDNLKILLSSPDIGQKIFDLINYKKINN